MQINEKGTKTRKKPSRTKPVSLNITLTEEQKIAKATCLDNQIVFLTGKPGTSKTTVACVVALGALINDMYKKIIITRPTVNASKDIGFLPGDAFDFKEGKMAPYIAPIISSMIKLKDEKQIDDLIKNKKIEIVPIQFARGMNFEDAIVIVDESQNCTVDELKTLTTRMCRDSKMILTSDINQVDLFNKNRSSANFIQKLQELDGVAIIELKENFRSPLSLQIMDMIDEQLKDNKVL